MKRTFETEIAKLSQVLSDPIRVKILLLLKKGPEATSPICKAYPNAVCPTDLQISLDHISSSKLSYHLKLLKDENLIQEYREGKRIYYQFIETRVKDLIGLLEGLLV